MLFTALNTFLGIGIDALSVVAGIEIGGISVVSAVLSFTALFILLTFVISAIKGRG